MSATERAAAQAPEQRAAACTAGQQGQKRQHVMWAGCAAPLPPTDDVEVAAHDCSHLWVLCHLAVDLHSLKVNGGALWGMVDGGGEDVS